MRPKPPLLRLALTLSAGALAGCYSAAELGYTNTARPRGAGGGTLTVRTGPASLPNLDSTVGLDLALRADVATSGSRLATGPSALLAPPGIRDERVTPYVRPSLWWSPARWGPARDDFFLTPALEGGALLVEGPHGSQRQRVYQLGARLEYLGRHDTLDRNLAWAASFSIGSYNPAGNGP